MSHRAKKAATREKWQKRAREAARAVLPEGHYTLDEPVAVNVYFFPQDAMQADIDNCTKPILDAMCGLIYMDDRQVDRLVVQKFEPARPMVPRGETTKVLEQPLEAEEPVVYFRIEVLLGGERPNDDLRP